MVFVYQTIEYTSSCLDSTDLGSACDGSGVSVSCPVTPVCVFPVLNDSGYISSIERIWEHVCPYRWCLQFICTLAFSTLTVRYYIHHDVCRYLCQAASYECPVHRNNLFAIACLFYYLFLCFQKKMLCLLLIMK